MKTFYNPELQNQNLSGIEWNGNCPMCGKSNHFYMNSKNGLWSCKKCGEEGNWFQYQRKVKIGFTIEEEETNKIKNKIKIFGKLPNFLEDEKEEIKLEGLSGEENKKFIYKVLPTIELPNSFIDISKRKTPEAYNYIIKRRYSKGLIEKYDLMYGTSGNYFNRIIIPVYLRGRLKGYLGRWIDIPNYKPEKKYRNSYGTDFSFLLGNYDFINKKKVVVICEGAFSSYRIGFNSVYSFGKKLSNEQIYLLKKKYVKEILLLYDSDAKIEIVKIAEKLLNENFIVRILFFENGDPADLAGDNIRERVLEESKIYESKQTIPIIKFR